MAATQTQKFLWVCELTKDQPTKKWNATDVMELEDEEDSDFMINSLILKSAMLGAKATDNERNIVAVKTKGIQDNDIEHPIFSLTAGRLDMIANFDLPLASRDEVEFKLIEGAGPVFITCSHVLEMPSADEQQTMMTTSDGEDLEEEDADGEDEEADGEDKEADGGKTKRLSAAALKSLHKNGKNGEHANGNGKECEAGGDEKPSKRKRN